MRRIVSASIPHAGATASGVNAARCSPIRSSPLRDRAQVLAGVGEALLEDHVSEPGEQVRVMTGADEVVLVGDLRSARATRVDNDDAAAALTNLPQAPARVGDGHQRAVRSKRVGAEDEQIGGPIEVRDRDREPAAEHVRAGDLLRHLVDRGRREDVARAQALEQRPQVHGAIQCVRVRVADVGGDCVAVAVGEDRAEALLDRREGLLPARLDQLAVTAHEWPLEPVRVAVQLPEAGALRADEAGAEDIVRVATDLLHLAAVELDLEPAGRLAQWARAVMQDGAHLSSSVAVDSLRPASGRAARTQVRAPRACRRSSFVGRRKLETSRATTVTR